jgi:hypothetical protein
MDEIGVRAECFAQCHDLELYVLFRHDGARPHPAYELLFSDERAVGLQQGQQEIERTRAELDWNAIGEQLSPAQQNAEPAEFEIRAGGCPVRVVSALRNWVSASRRLWSNIRLHRGFSRLV